MNPTEHKSETPMTDAMVSIQGIRCSCAEAPIDLCYKLEVERDQLRARVGELEKLLKEAASKLVQHHSLGY